METNEATALADNAEEFTLGDWAKSPIPVFDLNAEYDERVQPLMKQVDAVCEELGIPYFFHAVIGQDESSSHNARSANLDPVDRLTPELLFYVSNEKLTDAPHDAMRILTASKMRYAKRVTGG